MTRLRRLWERGPQRVVVALGLVVVALVAVMVAALVRANGDDDVEATGTTEAPTTTAATTTEPPTTTTTVPETTTTTSPWTPREQEVVEAFERALDVAQEAAAPPEPDPEHPGLPRTYTGDQLEEVVAGLEILVHNNTALRYPDDSVASVDIESVEFDQVDGREAARLDVCTVTDSEEISLRSGEPLSYNEGLRTVESTNTLHKVDGMWKVADLVVHDRTPGEVECTFD